MSDKVQIDISARETASKAFAQVGAAAQKMSSQVEDAGESFEDFGKSAEDNARSVKEMEDANKEVGRGLLVLGSALALAGQSFRDQEVALRTLERGYGDATDEMVDFAQQIQDTTNFSNDAAVAAANTAATLGRNYGFTFEEIQRVLQISADLAAATGFSLEDATQRVVAALRGEAEAAEQLGLTMNQAAIDSQNLTLSMSNQEAGHFRLNALIDQSAFAMGSAAEQADTTYGAMTDLRDGVQDAAQSFGEFLGPLGEVGAFAADNAVQLAIMGVALKQLATSASAANTVMGASGLLGTLLKFGPLATGAAIGIAAVAVSMAKASEAGVDAGELFTEAAEGIDLLRETADGFAATSMDQSLIDLSDEVASTFENFERLQVRFQELQELWADDELTGEQEVAFQALQEQLGNTEVAALNLGPAMQAVSDILNAVGPSAADAQADLAELDRAVDANEISFEEYLSGAIAIAEGLGEADRAAGNAAESVNNLTIATEDLTAANIASIAALNIANDTWQDRVDLMGLVADEERFAALERERGLAGLAAETVAADAAIAAIYRRVNAGQDLTEQQAAEAAAAAENVQAIADQSAAYMDLQAAIATPLEALDNVFRVVVGNTDNIVSSLESVHTWIDNLVTVVDQTDVWGNWIGQWSELDALLGAGEISIQDHAEALIAHDRIAAAHIDTQREVNALQAEYAPLIATSAERLADYVVELRGLEPGLQLARLGFMDSALSAQAMQLQMFALSGASEEAMNNIIGGAARADPVLSAMLDQMGLIDVVEGEVILTVEGQSDLDKLTSALDRATLTNWMITYGVDAATAEEQLNDLFGTAQDWDGSEFTATVMAENAPAEEAIGQSEGRLHFWEQSTGTATADADNAPSQQQIAAAQQLLSEWDGAVGTGDVNADNSMTLASLQQAASGLTGWGNSSGTADVNAADNASGPISNAIGLLNAFDNRTATAYIYTIGVVSGSFGPTPVGHGGVVGYADGGVVAKMGEWGPEMLHFPGGGVAMAQTPGLYTVPRGTYVDSAPATAAKLSGVAGINVHLNIGGNVYGIDDLTEQVTRQLVPAIQRASSSWLRGHGL